MLSKCVLDVTEIDPSYEDHETMEMPLSRPVTIRGQVAELQQMIKERDAEIENYEEILKQPTMDLQAGC